MRVVSWNIDSIRVRIERVEAWIDANRPDVICLQETKVADRSFPKSPFLERGFELAIAGSGGQGGVAIASKGGLRDVRLGIPGAKPPLADRRSISASCRGLRIHNVYGPNGGKVGTRQHAIKLAWHELFRAWICMEGLDEGQPTMVIGDLNIAPTDLDVWEPERYRKRNLTSPAERQAFARLIDAGLVDLMRAENGDRAIYTWWNRRGDFYLSDRGWRLDHILSDPRTASGASGALIDRAERGKPGASDHAPVQVDLDL